LELVARARLSMRHKGFVKFLSDAGCGAPGIKLDLVSGRGAYLRVLSSLAASSPLLGEREFTDGAVA
jgi:hypothetical protein